MELAFARLSVLEVVVVVMLPQCGMAFHFLDFSRQDFFVCPSSSRTHFVDQIGLKPRDPPPERWD